MKQFRCIGAECEDTCCAGWNVNLDQTTYTNYLADHNSPLTHAFQENIQPNTPSEQTKNKFATMTMNPKTRACSFLNEGLCAIQAHKGESFLPNTCFNFPRLNYQFNRTDFQVLSLGCPEAARLALLNENAFNFEQLQLEIRENTSIHIHDTWGFNAHNMEEIRLFCLQLAQTNGIENWQKLLILGLFCESINDLIQAKQQDQAPFIIQETIKPLSSGELLASMNAVPCNLTAQASLFASFWRACNKAFKELNSYSSPLQAQVIQQVHTGIFQNADQDGPTNQEAIVQNYTHGLQHLQRTLTNTPYFEKNILINELLLGFFPFAGQNIQENYLRLIAQQCLLRFMLAGVSNTLGVKTTPVALAQTVQVFYRIFHHNEQIISFFVSKLQEMGLNQLNKLVVLLRVG